MSWGWTNIIMLPINQKAYVNSFLRQIDNNVKNEYYLDDLSDAEQLELYKMILPMVNKSPQGEIRYPDYTGETFRDVSNPTTRRQLQQAIDDELSTAEEAQQWFPGINDPISNMEFIKNLSSPVFALKTFLGQSGYYTDEDGNIIIDDSFDFNIGRERDTFPTSPQQAFREGFSTEGSSIFNILRGVGSLLGPKEGEGARIHLNLGTEEDIIKKIAQMEEPQQTERMAEIMDELGLD
tara:strand:- start:15 stop:725 length:711 start_codon:yes stop_codon:yes gene_type:complete